MVPHTRHHIHIIMYVPIYKYIYSKKILEFDKVTKINYT